MKATLLTTLRINLESMVKHAKLHMRNVVMLGIFILISLVTCRPHREVTPNTVWSAGCIELGPYQGGYRLDGLCCTYVVMDPVDLTTDRFFISPGVYYVYTGAGFAGTAISIQGQVAPDHSALLLSFVLPGQSVPQVYRLEQGREKVYCQCGCD